MASTEDFEIPDSAFHEIWDAEDREKTTPDPPKYTSPYQPTPRPAAINAPSVPQFGVPAAATSFGASADPAKDQLIAHLTKQVSDLQAAKNAAEFERDFKQVCNFPEHAKLVQEKEEAEIKRVKAEKLMSDAQAESRKHIQRVKSLEKEASAQIERHKKELAELAKVGGSSAEEIAARERVLETEKRGREEARQRGDIYYEMRMDGYTEGDNFRTQIVKAKHTTCGIVRDSSVNDWIPQAADTIANQQRQLDELNRKLERIEQQNVDATKLAYYEKEFPILEKDFKKAYCKAVSMGPEHDHAVSRAKSLEQQLQDVWKNWVEGEQGLNKTIQEQSSTIQTLQSRLLGTSHLPLAEDEKKAIQASYYKSQEVLKAQLATSTADIKSKTPKASGNKQQEFVPDPSTPSTFGLFYDDHDSDSSDEDTENEDSEATSPLSAVPTHAHPPERKSFSYYLGACWKSKRLILVTFLLISLVFFDIYRVLAPSSSPKPNSDYDESIYNDQEVTTDDLEINWTVGVPSYANDAPVVPVDYPEYEIIAHDGEAPPAWHVVRETGYDVSPESSQEPPVANGLLSGTLAVLSASVFAADSYTWMMGWKGTTPH